MSKAFLKDDQAGEEELPEELEERPVGRDGLERALETPLETAGPCR